MDTTEMSEKAQNWQKTAEDLQDQAEHWGKKVSAKAQDTGKAIQSYVQDNTWTSVAIAAALGCVIGLLMSRGRGD